MTKNTALFLAAGLLPVIAGCQSTGRPAYSPGPRTFEPSPVEIEEAPSFEERSYRPSPSRSPEPAPELDGPILGEPSEEPQAKRSWFRRMGRRRSRRPAVQLRHPLPLQRTTEQSRPAGERLIPVEMRGYIELPPPR